MKTAATVLRSSPSSRARFEMRLYITHRIELATFKTNVVDAYRRRNDAHQAALAGTVSR